MKILVTGSAGRLGGMVIPALEARGHEIVPYDLQNDQDIFDRANLEAAMRGCRQVVHLAGIPGPVPKTTFPSFYHTNCDGTLAVVRAALESGVQRLIYSGSTAFYGVEPGIFFHKPIREGQAPITCYAKADELTCTPFHMSYDVSKIIAEQILAYYGLMKELEIIVLRLGPLKAKCGCTPEIAAEAICRAVEHLGPFWYEVFNVVESKFDWAISYKARAVLGLEL